MYHSVLDIRETQAAVKYVKDYFEDALAKALHLMQFDLLETGEEVQIVQSLAKWKRYALGRYGFIPGEGLYTDMNAIRRDEITDALHSVYVDQWDWEKVIAKEDRTPETLRQTVDAIYEVLKRTEKEVLRTFPKLAPQYQEYALPDKITYITAQELEDLYPDLSPKEREKVYTRRCGALCLIGIGDTLRSGIKHDGRSPDYDDWTLNCDILLYYPVMDIAFEISSMGIRVDAAALTAQLSKAGCEDRAQLPFHRSVLNGTLPYTIGGGIGQSRLCMYFLRKMHIGEVQVSVWPETQEKEMRKKGCYLL